jgi:hypothetical protein
MKRTVITALLALVLAPVAGPAAARGSSWSWIRIEPNRGHAKTAPWTVIQGQTTVALGPGGAFSIPLNYDDGRYSLRYVLKGTIHGNTVRAREIHLESDAPDLELTGRYWALADGKYIHLDSGLVHIELRAE